MLWDCILAEQKARASTPARDTMLSLSPSLPDTGTLYTIQHGYGVFLPQGQSGGRVPSLSLVCQVQEAPLPADLQSS